MTALSSHSPSQPAPSRLPHIPFNDDMSDIPSSSASMTSSTSMSSQSSLNTALTSSSSSLASTSSRHGKGTTGEEGVKSPSLQSRTPQSHSFAVPAVPQRSKPRPLSMSTVHNLPSPSTSFASSSKNAEMTSEAGPSNSKLKRLSLIARPRPSSMDPVDDFEVEIHEGVAVSSTPVSGGASGDDESKKAVNREKGTPRRMKGMRSSISYSPATTSRLGEGGFEPGRLKDLREGVMSPRAPMGIDSSFDRVPHPVKPMSPDDATKSRTVDWQNAQDINGKRKGETLVERHGDLLTLIAQKERKVNEIKQELAQQEAALAQLKSKWTAVASQSGPSAPPRTRTSNAIKHPLSGAQVMRASVSSASYQTPKGKPGSVDTPPPTKPGSSRAALMESVEIGLPPSAATSSSSRSSSDERLSPSDPMMALANPDQASLSALLDRALLGEHGQKVFEMPSLATMVQNAWSEEDGNGNGHGMSNLLAVIQNALGEGGETLWSSEAVDGGKRFLSQLIKTVGAAAGGTVPSESGSTEDQARSPKLDISSIKAILPTWNTSSTSAHPASPPPRPANAARLNRSKKQGSNTSLSSNSRDAGSRADHRKRSSPRNNKGRCGEASRSPLRMDTVAPLEADLLDMKVESASDDMLVRTSSLESSSSKVSRSSLNQGPMDEDEQDDGWGW